MRWQEGAERCRHAAGGCCVCVREGGGGDGAGKKETKNHGGEATTQRQSTFGPTSHGGIPAQMNGILANQSAENPALVAPLRKRL
jgi:hypothetical protein